MNSSRHTSHALKVCVCGTAENQVLPLLHSLATGQMFGHAQPLRLVLQDTGENACELTEEALDLHDACYLLVMGVETETDLAKSLSQSDVIVVILPTTRLEDVVPVIADYAAALNRSPRTKQKAVIVVGQRALPAAGALCVLSPQLTPHLVTAVELPDMFFKHSKVGRGGYILAKTVTEHVSYWWSGLPTNSTVMKRVKFPGFPHVPGSPFLPLPVRTTASERKQRRNSSCSVEREHFRQALQDFSTILKHLQLNETQLVSSVISCQL